MSNTTTRRGFLQATGAAAAAPGLSGAGVSDEGPSGVRAARRHKFETHQPTPDFFEGMLLGNGDLGVCVTVRPDALGLHIGKSDSWDIRVSEDHYQHVLGFPEFIELWRRASEEAKRQGKPDMLFLEREIDFMREYTTRVRSSYAESWPRPWPCGIVWIHWDARKVRVVRQELDPSCGLLTITLRYDDLRGSWRSFRVFCSVNWSTNLISVSTDAEAPFRSVAYYPNLDADAKLPSPEIDAQAAESYAEFSAFQRFPATVPTAEEPSPPPTDKDSSFALAARLSGSWSVEGLEESRARLAQPAEGADTYTYYRQPPRIFMRGRRAQPFRLDLTV
ncbi:MAG: twin-arginine translocation signal domain-containing protein, partial [bacterium]|nr:twin-arginine translocation signal domain-containing protein [bacterium]